ncbi:carboxy terminal-processing peptidase [Flavisolibacter sp. BT320]|nr:carboxy terminal-processing peptidase [Flavisolibacter longurius]
MNWKNAFLGWMTLSLGTTATAQTPAAQQQAIVLKRTIERTHYSPRAVNDSFSLEVFNRLLAHLDPAHLLLTGEEVSQLSSFRLQLDDELQGGGWAFLDRLTPIYGQAVRRADSLVNLLLQKPLDLASPDKLLIGTGSPQKYAANIAELKGAWTKYAKLKLLQAAYELSQAQSPKLLLKDVLAKQEPALRQKIRKTMLQTLERYKDPAALQEMVQETYLVTVSQAFDPHTVYLSPVQNDRFKTALSKEDASYGFVLGEKDGKTVVQHLVPGGPAWRSGEVHRNDQLLQLRFDGGEVVDATLLDAEEAEELLAETEARTVTIRVKKGDGSEKTIILQKEKLEAEEARVKGYVLNGEKKIGYISLPDFYTSWEDGAGSSCAEDVAKEIVALKKEGIEGLILDVRYNGGGSMQESVEMIGIFVNDGPVFAVKDKTKASFLKDPNRGTIWDGPMVVMINGQSASASESLAGSLQDLNRAVIVGSPSFGKATMQHVLPMDTTAGNRMVKSPFGFVKVTVGKLYRLDGNSAQLKGVQPDVLLPDAFAAVDGGERQFPAALPSDAISRNAYYKPLAPLPVSNLAAASAARIGTDSRFVGVQENLAKLAAVKTKKGEILLQPTAYEAWRIQNESLLQKESAAGAASTRFAVLNHGYEQQRLQTNTYAGEINKVQRDDLQKDIYIEETYRIVADLIQLTKPK